MANRVRKAVIPAAGYGTRFLPATKASPKEMMPIVDKPIIQYVVEEAVSAGIEEIVFVTSSNKRSLEDHFDYNFELEEQLRRSGKTEQLQAIRHVSDMARFVYVRQKEARGNGHAVLQAKDLVGDEPFLVLWGDDFLVSTPSRSAQLIQSYQEKQAAVLALFNAPSDDDKRKYGYIDGTEEGGYWRIKAMVEKPGPDRAPSDLANVGGFILTAEIFPILENMPADQGEIVLANAINILAQTRPVFGREIERPTYYDSGSKFGFIKANIDYGLKHPETRDQLLAYLKELRDA